MAIATAQVEAKQPLTKEERMVIIDHRSALS